MGAEAGAGSRVLGNGLTDVREAAKRYHDAEVALSDARRDFHRAVRDARASYSLGEIAEEVGLSRQRIHQIANAEDTSEIPVVRDPHASR